MTLSDAVVVSEPRGRRQTQFVELLQDARMELLQA